MELLTVQETATLLKVAPITVRRFIADGWLLAVRVGRGVRIEKENVEQLLQPAQKGHRPRGMTRPLTLDDPSFQLIGTARSGGPGDVAERTDDYLAEAYLATPE